ncbi:hypothetical protein H8356DRAFT_1647746, partial [Neocallimastix lanati (nom. inval.)]
MNSTLYNSNFHRGIHHYGCILNKFYMIFIHKLKNYNLSSSFFNIIFSRVRKFSPLGFYSYHLHSSSSFFNLCSSWNINSWNSEKRDVVMYLNSVFKP